MSTPPRSPPEMWDILRMVNDGYFHDLEKSVRWFYALNPGLGNVSPFTMVHMGLSKKLIKFIETELASNKPALDR